MLLVQVRPGPDGSLLLDWGSGRTVVYCVADGSTRYVHLDGHTLTFAVPEQRSSRRKSAQAGGDLTAQMPGQVVDVLVQAGQSVERGQTLVILEAMKMEIRVAAPSDGIVRQVLVAAGDVVERGQRLVEIGAAKG